MQKHLQTFGGISRSDGDPTPHCLKCGRPIDFWRVETLIKQVVSDVGYLEGKNTGQIILTVECYGERRKASNWRGRLV
ncbi:hypothetical protein [Bradyrhizobium iriomotense]|uniref:Uncharacterized protein n=1 Tax=Bradyrhizobium iriomotense TaxID=441950 RepID=A0ABQ6B6N0_9BRAD|nr:hypothetical protein [Bradyrhizobium iriomotense]GLR87692.1 hypothetical protein GCM10007857_44030 [Bradyrhizobium iriomotense]